MASMMQCPYKDCGCRFIVPWEKKDELMDCPFCSQPVFADRTGLVHLDEGFNPSNLPPIILPYDKTTKLELLCMGNAGAGYIHDQVGVRWYEPQPDEINQSVLVQGRLLPIRNFYRKDRINYCWFDVPENYLCWYFRHAQTKPTVEERRCFYMHEGQFCDLGEVTGGITFELFKRFYPQYKKWDVTFSG
jgi:hypothetical protein